ncbi:winged helix-turn-helix domain-containing protein [Paenibacillus nasutitermitis]
MEEGRPEEGPAAEAGHAGDAGAEPGSSAAQGTGEGSPAASPVIPSRDGWAASAGQSPGVRSGELSSGPFRLSSTERRLWKGGVEIVLTPTEWTLVMLLMEREGEGLSRDDILDAVWGRHFIGDLKIVDVNIRRIRQKLEDKPSDPRYIETLWGFGYRWKRGGH